MGFEMGYIQFEGTARGAPTTFGGKVTSPLKANADNQRSAGNAETRPGPRLGNLLGFQAEGPTHPPVPGSAAGN